MRGQKHQDKHRWSAEARHTKDLRDAVAKIIDLKSPLKRRRSRGFPEPRRRSRTAKIRVQVTDEVRATLEWWARMRGETIGYMAWRYFDALASLAEIVRRNGEHFNLTDTNAFKIVLANEGCIAVGDKDHTDHGRLIHIGSRVALSRPVDEKVRQVSERLLKLYPPHMVDDFLRQTHPKLGTSPGYAISQLRFREVDRVILSLERQARAVRKTG